MDEKEKKPVRLGREGTNEVPYPSFGSLTAGFGSTERGEIPSFGSKSAQVSSGREFPSFVSPKATLDAKEYPSLKREYPSFKNERGELPSLLGSKESENGSKKRRE